MYYYDTSGGTDWSRWGTEGRRGLVSKANSDRKHKATCLKNRAKRKSKKPKR